MKLTYDLINEENIKLASSIQGIIFPGESAMSHYEYSIATNYKNCAYYIVKWDNIPVGITGIYTMNMYNDNIENDDSVWLGWYGILPEFRSKGIGRQTLLDTMEKSKNYKRKYFRLYTNDTEDAPARPLYQSIMQKHELYQNEKDYTYDGNCAIYSYNLNGGKPEMWNNRYAYLKQDIEMEEKANQKLNDYYKIFIKLSNDLTNFMDFIKLATAFREDGHLVTLDTTITNELYYDIIINENPLLNIENPEEKDEFLNIFKNSFYKSYKK